MQKKLWLPDTASQPSMWASNPFSIVHFQHIILSRWGVLGAVFIFLCLANTCTSVIMPVCLRLYYFYNILIKHCKGTMATATDEIIKLGAKNIHRKFPGEAEAVNTQVKFLIEVCFCKDNLPWLSSRNLSLARGIVTSQNKSSNISCKRLAFYSFSRTQSFYTFFSLLSLLSQNKDTLSVLRHDLSGHFTKPCSVLKWWVSNPPSESTLSERKWHKKI